MTIQQIDTETGSRDLFATAVVLTHTPSATLPKRCQVVINMGDGANNLDGTGGDFLVTITIGGQTWDGGAHPQTIGTAVRAQLQTTDFSVPANDEVVVTVKSPNAADTAVAVTAHLFAIANLPAAIDAVSGGVAVTGAEININDTVTRQIEWTSASETITGTVQWTGQVAKAITGAIAFRETLNGKHYYTWAYNAADRPSVPSAGVLVLTDGTDTGVVSVTFVDGATETTAATARALAGTAAAEASRA